jgi:hypothetical protein
MSAAEAAALSGSDDSAPATNAIWSSSRIASRCTAPMKALRPPPTIPTLSRCAAVDASPVA